MSEAASAPSFASSRADDTDLIRRMTAVVGLAGIALVHLLDVQSKLEETPLVGVMFIALIVATLVLAELLVRGARRELWLAGAVLAGLTLLGYVISRTLGLPGAPADDIGNWFEPLGLASMLLEAAVVWVCVSVIVDGDGR
jgi:hypothetical protein